MQSVPDWVKDYNRRAYQAKLALDGATCLDYTLEQRLECFERALAIWPEGSYERNCIINSYPIYMGLLAERKCEGTV